VSRRTNVVVPSIVLDRETPVAIYLQLARQLADAIRRGALDGVRLPSTRTLAPLLGISRNTVLSAYDELIALGLIEARRGSGTHVPGTSSGSFATLSLLRAAQYPGRTLHVLDMDGGSIYLTS
jgi:GntR family transcriptional regulator / MocR family aminotransferase